MASRRLRLRWPRRTFPGGSEAIRVFSFPSWCLFHHPTIRKAWTNEAKGGLWRRSAPWSRLFWRKLGVPRNINQFGFFYKEFLEPLFTREKNSDFAQRFWNPKNLDPIFLLYNFEPPKISISPQKPRVPIFFMFCVNNGLKILKKIGPRKINL